MYKVSPQSYYKGLKVKLVRNQDHFGITALRARIYQSVFILLSSPSPKPKLASQMFCHCNQSPCNIPQEIHKAPANNKQSLFCILRFSICRQRLKRDGVRERNSCRASILAPRSLLSRLGSGSGNSFQLLTVPNPTNNILEIKKMN